MSDRDRIAEVVKPLILAEMRWPNDYEANLRAIRYANELIAAGCRMPATPRRAENTRSEKPSHRRWIAPRTGGYRPGGEFRADANCPQDHPPTPTTAPKGPGGVIPRGRSER